MFKPKNVTIPEFYKGKSVFMTGGTGFLGKVTVEKLLRSCPDIKNIYILIRPKKSMKIEERVEVVKNDPIFSVIKDTNPSQLDKIKGISGDVTELKLGLSEQDRAFLIKTVSLVFHVAASVRFDDFLQKAIITNIRGTREIIELLEQLNTVDVFVHVSTAYSNCDRKIIDEKIYPPKYDWREAIRLAESTEKEVKKLTDCITMKFIEPMPNTYVFTKGIAEDLVNDLCTNKFPTCIIRPSIVAPTIEEPVVGYVDNFNGPVTLFIAGGAGIAKVVQGGNETINDHVFADNVAKATIIACWQKGVQKTSDEIKVYNATSDFLYTPPQGQKYAMESHLENPLKYYIGAVNTSLIQCDYGYYIYNLLFHLFPALIFDVVLKMMGQKVRILNLRRKLVISNMALLPFMRPDDGISWSFVNKNYIGLENTLLESDKKAFSYLANRSKGANDIASIKENFTIFTSKCRKFLLPHERDQATDAEVTRYKRVVLLDKIVKNAFWVILGYIVLFKTNLISKFANYLENL